MKHNPDGGDKFSSVLKEASKVAGKREVIFAFKMIRGGALIKGGQSAQSGRI